MTELSLLGCELDSMHLFLHDTAFWVRTGAVGVQAWLLIAYDTNTAGALETSNEIKKTCDRFC